MINTPGQMNPNSDRGKKLIEFIKNKDFSTIVEIGTWNGLGSTICVLQSKKQTCDFYSLESNRNFFEIALTNLSENVSKINLIHGSIVTFDELKKYSENLELNSEQNKWLQEDLKNLEKINYVLEDLPLNIDLLILDGGEFASYIEWTKLKSRVKFVALDDTKVLKNQKVVEELSRDENFLLIDSSDEGHGFAIFEKR